MASEPKLNKFLAKMSSSLETIILYRYSWELKIKFNDVGGPTMVGSKRERKILKLYLLERLKKHPPD